MEKGHESFSKIQDVERQLPNYTKQRRVSDITRPWRRLPSITKNCVLAIVVLIAWYTSMHHLRLGYEKWWTKQIPTDLKPMWYALSNPTLLKPEKILRYANETHIDDVYMFMKHLGGGMEGTADQYWDMRNDQAVVVKRFYKPGFNQIPEPLRTSFSCFTETWPVEIEAGLLLQEQKKDNSVWSDTLSNSYMPVLDYFLIASDDADNCEWAMVTKLASGRTLKSLALTIRHENDSIMTTASTVDQKYRRNFDTLLVALAGLHSRGYCHDDIRPDNIFVDDGFIANDPAQVWLLGDLNQLRSLDHPWHRTYSWNIRQRQLSDCRINDVRRLLKTYLTFLRVASSDDLGFDLAYAAHNQPWSKLHAEFMNWAGSDAVHKFIDRHVDAAGTTAATSQKFPPDDTVEQQTETVNFKSISEAKQLAHVVKKDLECTLNNWMVW